MRGARPASGSSVGIGGALAHVRMMSPFGLAVKLPRRGSAKPDFGIRPDGSYQAQSLIVSTGSRAVEHTFTRPPPGVSCSARDQGPPAHIAMLVARLPPFLSIALRVNADSARLSPLRKVLLDTLGEGLPAPLLGIFTLVSHSTDLGRRAGAALFSLRSLRCSGGRAARLQRPHGSLLLSSIINQILRP
jgi:hypothetical protein